MTITTIIIAFVLILFLDAYECKKKDEIINKKIKLDRMELAKKIENEQNKQNKGMER